MGIKIKKQDALNYHTQGQPGKIEVVPTKKVSSQRDLALAYSPGVAEPCIEISQNPEDVYKYTAKGNLVGVITNGTAVLGLGNIGPEASKPVMEGKGVLFKKFAGIDVFDIELDAEDPEDFIRTVKALEPTFGGINLEDIKAPESFLIEDRLKKEMNIPVMHDDQHGTAIVSAAALLNALELVEKDITKVKMVVNGAGGAALSCTKLYHSLGMKKENIVMIDRKGVIRKDRNEQNVGKAEFATSLDLHTLDEAIKGADIFLGLSTGNVMTPEMVKDMGKDPIIFALANPEPEIPYNVAMKTRDDILMATGRSDHPNQVNNVLGFPYIFRGALDVRATAINEEMKMAAVRAIAELTKEPVPDVVNKAYGETALTFSKEYFLPKPIDPRLITTISPAVAKAAMDSGVARKPIKDWDLYEEQLLQKLGIDQKIISRIVLEAKKKPKRVVFAEAEHQKILKAAQIVADDNIAFPILLGRRHKIEAICETHSIELPECEIIDPYNEEDKRSEYGKLLYEKRKRKGVTMYEAGKLMRDRNYFAAMMVENGDADAMVSGLTKDYPRTIRPALEVIGTEDGISKVAGMYLMLSKRGPFALADTTVNKNPSHEDLVSIVGLTARMAKFFDIEPRIAMLSYSNFGSSRDENALKMMNATAAAREAYPGLVIDGEIQANIAINKSLIREHYPFSELAEKGANTLIFPNLEAGNIAYKLLQELGEFETIGPVLMGMKKPVHIVQQGSTVREIANMVAIAVVDAQRKPKTKNKKVASV